MVDAYRGGGAAPVVALATYCGIEWPQSIRKVDALLPGNQREQVQNVCSKISSETYESKLTSLIVVRNTCDYVPVICVFFLFRGYSSSI